MTHRRQSVVFPLVLLAVVLLPAGALAQASKPGGAVTALDPGQSAFLATGEVYIQTNGNTATSLNLFPAVPGGKRFVIESLGMRCGGAIDDTFPIVTVKLRMTAESDVIYFPLIVPPMTPSWGDGGVSGVVFAGRLYTVGQLSLLVTHSKYTDPETELGPYCAATASGYLVDYK